MYHHIGSHAGVSFRKFIDDCAGFQSRQFRAAISFNLHAVNTKRFDLVLSPGRELSFLDEWYKVLVNLVHHLVCRLAFQHSTRGEVLVHFHGFPNVADRLLQITLSLWS